MEKNNGTDRRAFLKTGALAVTPIAAIAAPAAAFAADDNAARLARLEDERAIEALHRKLMRHLNGGALEDGMLAAPDAVHLDADVAAVWYDPMHELQIAFADNGRRAHIGCDCRVERRVELTGCSTVEQMARLQGHGSHTHTADSALDVEFGKGKDSWQVVQARFA